MVIDETIFKPDAKCRARYSFLNEETIKKGLECCSINDSRTKFSKICKGIPYLKNKAFRPTGVCLGCPLPDNSVVRQLSRVCDQFGKGLIRILGIKSPPFAFVPSASYHITLVNWAHFDCGRKVCGMPASKIPAVQNAVNLLGLSSIKVHLKGVILTTPGRLIVPGYPLGPDFYNLRTKLTALHPKFKTNLPNTAHVKLGHVISSCPPIMKNEILNLVSEVGKEINCSLIFKSIWTPHKTIAF